MTMVTKRTTKTRAQRPTRTRTTAGKRPGKAKTASRGRVAAKNKEERFVGKHIFAKGKVSSKGWVVIPKEIRDEMGIKPGDQVSFALSPPMPGMKQDRGLYSLHVHRVPEDIVSLARGLFPAQPGEPSWTENLLRERRLDLEREEREIREDRRRHRA
jgi:AbrB family looped-hinge helix DNA binding protein